MPTYEYACKACGQHVEVVQSFRDAPLTECPHCGGDLRKVFGNIGIAFKGSGFYKTDSRTSAKGGGSSGSKGGEAAGSDAKAAESKGGDSGSGSSSDTKSSEPKGAPAAAAS